MQMNRGIIRINAPVILVFTLICFLAYCLNKITSGFTNHLIFSVYRGSLADPFFYLRLIAHVFGHADWAHFSGNIMYILLLGPLLEDKYGSWNMGVIIILTALATGIFHVLFFPSGLLGASGVVFAFIILSSISGMKDRKLPITFIIVVIIFLGGQVIDGMFVRNNISNMTHILGGMIGGGCGYMLNNRK